MFENNNLNSTDSTNSNTLESNEVTDTQNAQVTPPETEVFIDPTINTSTETNPNPQKKEKNPTSKTLLFIVIMILVVGIAGFTYYKYCTKNPTEIIKKVINQTYDDFSSALKNYEVPSDKDAFNFLTDSIKITGSLNFKDDNNKNLEKEKINYVFGLDYQNKKAEMSASLTQNTSTLLDANVYLKNDNMYLSSKTLLNNTYNVGRYKFDELFDFSDFESQMNDTKEISLEDIDYIVKEFKDALVDSLEKDKMKETKEKITIDGEELKTTKITYDLDYKAICHINNSVIDRILENETTVEKLANLIEIDEDTLKENLEDAKLDEIEKPDDFTPVEFSIYTTGVNYKLVKIEVKDNIDSFETIINNDKVQMTFTSKEEKVEVTITEKDERYEIKVKLNDAEITLINIKEATEEVLDIDYVYNYENVDIQGNIKITVDKNTDREYGMTIDFKIDGKMDNQPCSLDMSLTANIEKGASIANTNLNGAINSENITEEDMQKAMLQLSTLENSEIYKYFLKMMSPSMLQY